MVAKQDLTSTRDAMRILDRDRSTVIRYAKAGRLKIIAQLPGQGAYVLDRRSVEKLRAELAAEAAITQAANGKADTEDD